MATIQKWTGRESRALREALRLSVRDFAAQLGVSDRAVSKWEAGGADFVPRPDSQAILDTRLAKASQDVRARFALFLGTGPDGAGSGQEVPVGLPQDGRPETAGAREGGYPRQVTHPVDGRVMALVDAGSFPSGPGGRPLWLPAFYMDVYPVANRDYAAFVRAAGHVPPPHWEDGGFPPGLFQDSHMTPLGYAR